MFISKCERYTKEKQLVVYTLITKKEYKQTRIVDTPYTMGTNKTKEKYFDRNLPYTISFGCLLVFTVVVHS